MIDTLISLISNFLTSSTPGNILKNKKQSKQLYHFFVKPFLEVLATQDEHEYGGLVKKVKKNKNLFLEILISTFEEFKDEIDSNQNGGILFPILRKDEFNRKFISNLLNHKKINIEVPESSFFIIMPSYVTVCIERIHSELDERELKNLINNLLERDPRDVKWSLSTFWLTEILKNLKEKDVTERKIAEKLTAIKQIIDTSFTWDEFREACKNQRQLYLELLKAKYDAVLYVPRKNIEDEFNKFICSDSNLFAVIGESGFGKTNILVHLAQESDYPALFFSGEFYRASEFLVEKEIERLLLTELGGRSRFREMISSVVEKEGINLVQKISQMNEQKVLIFIDAINEFVNPAGVLESLTRTIVEYANKYPNLKFIISCRKTSWKILIERDKVALPCNWMYTPAKTETLFSNLESERWGIEVKEFNDEELEEAYRRYQEKYKLDGGLSLLAEKVCKNPLMLKIISEIYKGESIPGDVEKLNVFDRYWTIKIESGIPGKESLLYSIVLTMREEKCEELNVLLLESQPYFKKEAFDELKDEGILVEYQHNYENKIKFSYERFFEYTLARYLLNHQSSVFSELETFIKEAEKYGPLRRALEYFISMPISFSRKKFLEALFNRGKFWHDLICDLISGLDDIDDNMFKILDKIASTTLGGVQVGYSISKIASHNPHKTLDIAKKIAMNFSNDRICNLSSAWFPLNAICKSAPEMIKEMEKWLKNKSWKMKAAAINPIIQHMGNVESIETVLIIKNCKKHPIWRVRESLAISLAYISDDYNDLCLELADDLVEDDVESVRAAIADSLGWKIRQDPTLIKHLYKWAVSPSWKARQAAALSAYLAFETDPDKVFTILKELSEYENTEINKGIIKALLRHTLSISIINTFPRESLQLLENIVAKSDGSLRSDVYSCLMFARLDEIGYKAFAELITAWSNHESWKVRELSAAISGVFHKDNPVPMEILRKLASDVNLNVRKKVADELDFCDEKYLEELKIILPLYEDNEWEVRMASISSMYNFYRHEPDNYLTYLKKYLIREPGRAQRLLISAFLYEFFKENVNLIPIWEKWLKEGNYKIEEALIGPLLYLIASEIEVKKCFCLLKNILGSKEWSVRMTATIFLAFLIKKKENIRQAIDLLSLSSKDTHFIIRRQAVKSLFSIVLKAKYYSKDIIKLIEGMAEDRDWSVRQRVAFFIDVVFPDCPLAFLEKYPEITHLLLNKLCHNKDWCVRASTIYSAYYFKNKNPVFFDELVKDKNPHVRKWAKLCEKQKPKITDKACFEYENQEYIRDVSKFAEEIEYFAELNEPEETLHFLNNIRKYNESGLMKITADWKYSESPNLRESFSKLSSSTSEY